MAAHKMEVGICNIYIQQGTHIQTIHEKLLQINQTAQYKKTGKRLEQAICNTSYPDGQNTCKKKKKIIMKKHSEKSSISIVVREININ